MFCVQLHHAPNLACLWVVVEQEGLGPVIKTALDAHGLTAVKVRLWCSVVWRVVVCVGLLCMSGWCGGVVLRVMVAEEEEGGRKGTGFFLLRGVRGRRTTSRHCCQPQCNRLLNGGR